MRICSPHVGISPESNLGGEVYEREILKHLALLGVQSEIILPRGKPYEKNIPNWRVHYTFFGRGYRWYTSNLVFPAYIKRVYDRVGFDVLRVHSLRFVGPAALWARRLYRLSVPVVAHHHHLDVNWLNGLIEKRVIEGADCLVTDSDFSKEQLVNELGIDPAKITVVRAGIDQRFVPQPKDEALLEKWGLRGKQVALYLGGLTERKGLRFLLGVFQQIKAVRGEEVAFVVVGSGPLENELKRKAERLELPVVFTGYVPEKDKVKYYNLADVFVFPSRLEGFGLVVGEAMSCAIAVVVSRAGSLPELVADGETGFLAELNNKSEFVTRIVTLLDDDHLRSRLGQEARKRVSERFQWDSSARQLLAVYEKVLSTYGR